MNAARAEVSINRDKLGKVLALMASPIDGEALAAARMTVKMLAAAELRPEDLADPMKVLLRSTPAELTQTQTEPARHEPTSQPYTPTKPKPPSFRDLAPSVARMVLADMLAGELAEADRTFLGGLAEQMRTAPHKCLATAEVRRINRLWRVKEINR